MADLDLDRLEALARDGYGGCDHVAVAVSANELLALIARLREAEDAMNVCARCGEAIDAEVQAEEADAATPTPSTDNAR